MCHSVQDDTFFLSIFIDFIAFYLVEWGKMCIFEASKNNVNFKII
jgi:hypothetical protein